MAVCSIQGSADMYGLGIRLGYYLQWFGAILAAWIAPSEVKNLRFSIDMFASASFLALIILTARPDDSLQPAETYIILLLMFGAYLAMAPIYLWRLFTKCNPYWDPTRFPLANPGALSANLGFSLVVGVLCFQYWFWSARVSTLNAVDCQQYGFFFAKLRLNSRVSIALNGLMYGWLGVVCVYIIGLKTKHHLGYPEADQTGRLRFRNRRQMTKHVDMLRNLEGASKLVIAVIVTTATELTIQWNEIEDIHSLSSADQTIPFIIGLGSIIRVLYVCFKIRNERSDEDEYRYRYKTGQALRPIPITKAPSVGRPPNQIPDAHDMINRNESQTDLRRKFKKPGSWIRRFQPSLTPISLAQAPMAMPSAAGRYTPTSLTQPPMNYSPYLPIDPNAPIPLYQTPFSPSTTPIPLHQVVSEMDGERYIPIGLRQSVRMEID